MKITTGLGSICAVRVGKWYIHLQIRWLHYYSNNVLALLVFSHNTKAQDKAYGMNITLMIGLCLHKRLRDQYAAVVWLSFSTFFWPHFFKGAINFFAICNTRKTEFEGISVYHHTI